MTKCYMIMLKDNLLPDITETDIFSNYEKIHQTTCVVCIGCT